MDESPYQLYADLLTDEDRSDLVQFDCGSSKWAEAATEWIWGSDVLESIKIRKTRVWLYRNEQNVLVGYGSLGFTRRKWPPPPLNAVNPRFGGPIRGCRNPDVQDVGFLWATAEFAECSSLRLLLDAQVPGTLAAVNCEDSAQRSCQVCDWQSTRRHQRNLCEFVANYLCRTQASFRSTVKV